MLSDFRHFPASARPAELLSCTTAFQPNTKTPHLVAGTLNLAAAMRLRGLVLRSQAYHKLGGGIEVGPHLRHAVAVL